MKRDYSISAKLNYREKYFNDIKVNNELDTLILNWNYEDYLYIIEERKLNDFYYKYSSKIMELFDSIYKKIRRLERCIKYDQPLFNEYSNRYNNNFPKDLYDLIDKIDNKGGYENYKECENIIRNIIFNEINRFYKEILDKEDRDTYYGEIFKDKIDENNIEDKDDNEKEKNNDIEHDEIGTYRDVLAWYCPAHFNSPHSYGIYIPKTSIVYLAERIFDYAKKNNKSVSIDEAMVSSLAVLLWHELTHAWVEDICSIIESITKSDLYSYINKYYMSYIFNEEALCNSSAFGNLSVILNEIPNKNNILEAVENFFKSQPNGYRDFIELDFNPIYMDEFQFLFINSLLSETYKFNLNNIIYAYTSFFSTEDFIKNKAYWKWADNDYDRMISSPYNTRPLPSKKEFSYKDNYYNSITIPDIISNLYNSNSIYGLFLI